MNEKYYVDQIAMHSQLYKKFKLKENSDAFYVALNCLMVMTGLLDLDSALDYAIEFLN